MGQENSVTKLRHGLKNLLLTYKTTMADTDTLACLPRCVCQGVRVVAHKFDANANVTQQTSTQTSQVAVAVAVVRS